jgi:DUF1365 family protein
MKLVSMRISHTRLGPRRNSFRYTVGYILASLADLKSGNRSWFFAMDRPALFALRKADYGDSVAPLGETARRIFDECLGAGNYAAIVLLTLPRVFGYAFNPVSFWFCVDRSDRLLAVLAEVNNTFGERHFYLCTQGDGLGIERHRPIEVKKEFFVSPFFDLRGQYRFQFTYSRESIAIRIDYADNDQTILSVSMTGRPRPLSDAALLRSFLLAPWQGLKVIALIHWQALRLQLKGIGRYPKPPAAKHPVLLRRVTGTGS